MGFLSGRLLRLIVWSFVISLAWIVPAMAEDKPCQQSAASYRYGFTVGAELLDDCWIRLKHRR